MCDNCLATVISADGQCVQTVGGGPLKLETCGACGVVYYCKKVRFPNSCIRRSWTRFWTNVRCRLVSVRLGGTITKLNANMLEKYDWLE